MSRNPRTMGHHSWMKDRLVPIPDVASMLGMDERDVRAALRPIIICGYVKSVDLRRLVIAGVISQGGLQDQVEAWERTRIRRNHSVPEPVRDGRVCRYCGGPIPGSYPAHLDHVVPYALGVVSGEVVDTVGQRYT